VREREAKVCKFVYSGVVWLKSGRRSTDAQREASRSTDEWGGSRAGDTSDAVTTPHLLRSKQPRDKALLRKLEKSRVRTACCLPMRELTLRRSRPNRAIAIHEPRAQTSKPRLSWPVAARNARQTIP
jgi:hypothetical protein